jgi:RNA polymerase sigma factor for flagellar operon FliA
MTAVHSSAYRVGAPTDARERRDALVAQYRRYVLKIARSIAASLSVNVEIDDLAGWGYLGLIEAATRYDASRGVAFRSYAHHRIRGAILDGLRWEFGAPSQRGASSCDDAETAAGRTELCADASYAWDDAHGDGEPRQRRQDELWPSRGGAAFDPPDKGTWLGEVRVRLEEAMEALTPLERMVVQHYYVNGETVQSLARELNLSKSWLSRVHSRALGKLRAELLARAEDPEAYV